jgi:hypothetical protein
LAISAKRKTEVFDVDMDKAIESGVKELNTEQPSGGVARYGVVLDDGRWLFLNNTACHAGLNYLQNWKYEGPFDYTTRTRGPTVTVPPKVVINQVQEIKGDEEAATRFYEWLLNYSPFSSVFMRKTGKRVVEDHIIIGDCEAPANLLTGGMMASRLLSSRHLCLCGMNLLSVAFILMLRLWRLTPSPQPSLTPLPMQELDTQPFT